MIIKLKVSGKFELKMAINFISSKDSNETRYDIIEIMIGNETDEII